MSKLAESLPISTQQTVLASPIPSIHEYLQAATSQNTRRSYQADIRHFMAWGAQLPTTTDILLHYLRAHAALLNPKTLKRRLIALKHWHTFQGFPDPTAHPLLKKTLSGIHPVSSRDTANYQKWFCHDLAAC